MEHIGNNKKLENDENSRSNSDEDKKPVAEYKILSNKPWRESDKEAAFEVAEFLKDKKVKTIIALERSGRPAGILVREMYKILYPKDKLPNTFFINPKMGRKGLEKNKTLYTHLLKNPEESVAILDEYCASGNSILNVKYLLSDLGLKKVYCTSLGHSTGISYDFLDVKGGKYNAQWWFDHDDFGIGGKNKEYSQLHKEFKQLAEEIKDDYVHGKFDKNERKLEDTDKIEKIKGEIDQLTQKETPEEN